MSKNKKRWIGSSSDGKFKISKEKFLVLNAVAAVSCDPLSFESTVLEVCPIKPSSDFGIETIEKELSAICPDVVFIEQTKNLVVSDTSFFELAKPENTNVFITQISDSLNLTRAETVEKISNYFETTKIRKEPYHCQKF